VEHVILCRHAQSELSARSVCNGDPAAPGGGLSELGRRQAAALGVMLLDNELDLCAVTEFPRTQETAEIALEGRDVPTLVVPELNDIRFGRYEGGPLAEYREWAHHADAEAACPGGGESRADAARRFVVGYRKLLARGESSVLVIAHALPIRYVMSALIERDPSAVVEPVEYADPLHITAAQLERAVNRLERWCERPVFA
jgi:probable phosphoglycerate mutase